MKKIFVLVASLFLCTLFANAQNNVIDNELQKILNQKGNDYIDVNIMLKAQMTSDDFAVLNCKSDSKEVRREIVTNELKKFAEKSQKDIMSVLQAEERSKKVTDIQNFWIANFINCKAKADVIYQLASHPDVATISYNSVMEVVSDSKETESRDTRAVTATIGEHLTQIKAEKAWELGYTGKGVIVAVLDSGVNTEHADLKDHLWNGNPQHGYNVVNPGQNPYDDRSHGTHCAGIVCGDGTSGTMTGVAPDATLMSIKLYDSNSGLTVERLTSGIEFAIENKADILNISQGWIGASDANRRTLRTMFENLLDEGIIAVVACGNDREYIATYPVPGNIRTPGDCPPPWLHPDQPQTTESGVSSVVSVGAVGDDNNIVAISSQGPVEWDDYPYNPGMGQMGLIRPDIVAPATIRSLSNTSNDGYVIKGGTSQAAPCVAGVMALMLEKNPDLKPEDLCRIVERTTTQTPAKKDNLYGSGVVDALEAVRAVTFNVDEPVLNVYDFTRTFNAGSNLDLKLTLINNGKASTNGSTTVTISENDTYTTIVNNSATYGTMGVMDLQTNHSSVFIDDVTESATFVVSFDQLIPDNYEVTFTVNIGSKSFNIVVTVYNKLVAPTLTATANGTDINLSWNETNNATSYNIYRDGAFLETTTSTSYTDIGLEYGTIYAYTVTSKRGDLESEHSLTVRVQTVDNPAKPSPTNVVANNNGVVTWENGAESKGSNIYRKDYLAGTETSIATNVNGTSYTDNTWNSLADGVYQYGVANTYAANEKIYEEGFEGVNNWTFYNEGWSNGATDWRIDTKSDLGKTFYSEYGSKSAFFSNSLKNTNCLSYLVSPQFDFTEHNGSTVKLSFYYISPSWSGDVNTLEVMVSATNNGGWTQLWTNEKADATEWTKAEVNLSAYVGQQFYISFLNRAGAGYCTGVDNISIAIEGSSESRIVWSNNVYKNVNVFVQDGNWSNADNWTAKRLPNENDTKVIIDADATITNDDNITVNSLVINEGKSLTLNDGATLTVNGDFTNTDADAFIINDGAQVFQNNDDVAATFNMNIVTPGEWSESNKTGWQFIASPLKNAKIQDFIPTSSDYDLFKYDGTKELEWLNHKDETTYEVPTAPQNLLAEAISTSTIALSWDAVVGASSYKVYSGDGNHLATATSNTFEVIGLMPGTEYCYTVTAVNVYGESEKPSAVCTKTITLAPQNLQALSNGTNSIKLTWSDVTGTERYYVYKDDEKIASVASSSYTVNGLNPATEYCFTVTSVGSEFLGIESARSNEACATTDITIPTAPQNVVLVATSPYSVKLTWDPVPGADSYNIYFIAGGEAASGVVATEYIFEGLTPGMGYCYNVTAVNAKGESQPNGSNSVNTPLPTPEAPQLTATATGPATVKLTWNAPTYAETYKVYNEEGLVAERIPLTTYTVYDLEAGEHCFTVVAVGAGGSESEASNEECVIVTEQEQGPIAENVIIGDGNSSNSALPLNAFNAYSISQQIYTRAEIGQTGSIKAVSFKYKSGVTSSCTRTIKVYLKQTSQISFAGNTSWESMTDADEVFEGNITITDAPGEWVRINLNTPFEYTGNNLVVCVYDYTNRKEDNYIYFHTDELSETKSLYYAPYLANALDPENMNSKGSTSKHRNQIRFSFDTGAPEPPQNLVARSTDATTIHLSWDPSDGATSYEIYLGNMGGDPIETISDTEYDVTGLEKGHTYCYAVKAVNDKGVSGYSELECAKAGDVQLETIPITFILRDNWGDGWNGNKLSVSYPKLEGTFNGTYTIDDTYFDGYNQHGYPDKHKYTFTLKIPKGCNVTLTYIKSNGANPATNENSFDVKCENGTVLASAAEGSLTGVDDVFTFVADCTPKVPNAPVLEANATSSTEIALTWNKVAGATSYNVYQDDTEIATGLTTTTYNVEGLNPGTNYCFTVIAVNGVGESDASNEECARTMDAPTTPQNLVATVDGSSSITLTWNETANAISYNVYQDSEFIKNVTATTYVVKNLNPETKYCFTITSVNGDFESAATTPVCATTEDGKALKEIIVETGTDKNPNSEGNFYLPVYDYSAYAMSQQIYTAEELGGNIGEIGSIAFKLGNQVSSTTRQYEIYITNTSLNTFNGNSFVSVSENDKVFDGSVSISGIQDTWCTINFNNSFVYTGGNIIVTVYDKTGVALQNGFHLFYKYPTTGRSLYKQGSAINMSNLSTGNPQSYTAQIQLVITVDLTLSAPQDLVATTESASSISLSWKPVAVATSYNVYRNSELVANVTGTTYTDQGLNPETRYCYKVTSVKESDESEASNEECATTKMLAPSAPTTLVATANGENSIILTWSASATATSYNIFQGGNSVATGVTGTTYTVEGLKAGTEYCFTVKAVNSGGESAASNEDCAETDEKVIIGEEIVKEIGENATLSEFHYPLAGAMYTKYSISQQIYLSSEIQTKGTITQIQFRNQRGCGDVRNVYVYMQNTIATNLTSGWVNMTSEPVYQGEVVSGSANGDWVAIDLITPFEYTGGNLLICVYDATGKSSSNYSSSNKFYVYETSETRALVANSMSTTYDPTSLTYVSATQKQRNNQIKFTIISSSAKSSAPSAKMTDIKGGFDKVSAFGTSSGTELSKFETTFQQGIGYLASYETETTATFKGTLNHDKSYTFKLAAYDDSKNLANFNLLGNPFAFDMDWNKVTATNLVDGYAVVNEDGGYEYITDGKIKVGDGFFVKAIGSNPTLTYNARGNRNHEKASSLNVISSSKAGDDNVIINLAGEQEGFPKIKNFNENIAVVYVTEDDMAYGIYNCNEDALEVELAFKVSNMGEYNIHIEPNGYFDYVTLVDLSNGSETNMLTSSYSFTAVPKENGKRFVLKFAKSEMPEGQDNFVYQSGKELIVETEGTVQIIDIMGRVIYSNEVTNDNNRIDISGLHSAAYIVRLINNDSVKTQKVVVY